MLDPALTTKSGFMLGLGETEEEVRELLGSLREADVDIVTIGQYLRPSRENLPVVEYVPPEVFERHREFGERLGFRHVFAGTVRALLLSARRRQRSPRPRGSRGRGGR